MKIIFSILIILIILLIYITPVLAVEKNNSYLERVYSPSDYREIYNNKFEKEAITTSQYALDMFAIFVLIFIVVVMIILGIETGI